MKQDYLSFKICDKEYGAPFKHLVDIRLFDRKLLRDFDGVNYILGILPFRKISVPVISLIERNNIFFYLEEEYKILIIVEKPKEKGIYLGLVAHEILGLVNKKGKDNAIDLLIKEQTKFLS